MKKVCKQCVHWEEITGGVGYCGQLLIHPDYPRTLQILGTYSVPGEPYKRLITPDCFGCIAFENGNSNK